MLRPIAAKISLATLGAAIVGSFLWPGARGTIWLVVLGFHLVLAPIASFFMRTGLLGPVRSRGRTDRPEVALTFDDGPHPHTPALLDLLEERGAKATFFVVGKQARAWPDVLRRCVEAGHQIGNHSDKHSLLMNFYFARRMRADIDACQNAVTEFTGEAPTCYRPPVGLMNHCTWHVVHGLGLELVAWSVRSFDTLWGPERASRRVLKRAKPGAIILLHDTGNAVELTRLILDGLEERGLSPERLDRIGCLWQSPA